LPEARLRVTLAHAGENRRRIEVVELRDAASASPVLRSGEMSG